MKHKHRNPAPIKVTKPDPETGEVVEEEVPASRFKRQRKGIVTAKQRREILAGQHPALTFPGKEPCPVENGQVIEISSRVWITVFAVQRTKKGEWLARYSTRDDRPTFVRRVPPVHEPGIKDEHGIPHHDKAAIEAARVESAYTQDASQSIEPVDAVDVEWQNVLSVRARAKAVEERNPESEAMEDAQRLNAELKDLAKRASKLGIDSALVLAPIARQIEQAHAELSEEREAA